MGLGEGSLLEQTTLYLGVAQRLVAFDYDFAHLHLLLLVDDDVEYDLVFVGHVVALKNLYVGVLEAFVVEVFLCQYLGTVYHVGRNLCAFEQTELLLHVVALRLFQAHIVDCGHTGTHAQVDVEIYLVAHDGVGAYRHV